MKRQTKEKILKISLSLFSKQGYAATSVRDICKQVPIKQSTLYYYFQNKREIFQVLLKGFEEKSRRLMQQMEQELSQCLVADEDFGNGVMQSFFEEYLMDAFCNPFIRLLRIEEGNDEEMQHIYEKWIFDEPLRFQQKIFSVLINRGILKPADSAELAVQYYAPIFFYLQRYLLSGELTNERKERFRQAVNRQIDCFFREKGDFKWQM